MTFTVNTKLFTELIAKIGSASADKPGYRSFGHILLSIRDSKLSISASNNELWYTTDIQVLDDYPKVNGAVSVPANQLLKLLKRLKKYDVLTLSSDDDFHVQIRAGNVIATLYGADPVDFQAVEACPGSEPDLMLTVGQVRELLDKTLRFTSTDPLRTHLQGVYFHVSGQSLVAAATDCRQLSVYTIDPYFGEDQQSLNHIVSAIMLGHINKHIGTRGNETASVSFWFNDTHCSIVIDGISYTGKLIDSTFPDYASVKPTHLTGMVQFNATIVRESVNEIVSVMDKDHPELAITPTDESLNISSVGQSHGEVSTVVPYRRVAGTVLPFGIHNKHLLDVLAQFDDDIVLEMTGPENALLFHDGNMSRYWVVVMPMKLENQYSRGDVNRANTQVAKNERVTNTEQEASPSNSQNESSETAIPGPEGVQINESDTNGTDGTEFESKANLNGPEQFEDPDQISVPQAYDMIQLTFEGFLSQAKSVVHSSKADELLEYQIRIRRSINDALCMESSFKRRGIASGDIYEKFHTVISQLGKLEDMTLERLDDHDDEQPFDCKGHAIKWYRLTESDFQALIDTDRIFDQPVGAIKRYYAYKQNSLSAQQADYLNAVIELLS